MNDSGSTGSLQTEQLRAASMSNGGQLSPTAADGAGGAGDQPGVASSSAASDLTGDAEGVWSADIDQAFQEALTIYPPCGRRKIIISDEGKMYGRNELIARYIKIRCGKTRTRKQVSSHIQVLARKKARDDAAKKKAEQTPCTPTPAPIAPTPVPAPDHTSILGQTPQISATMPNFVPIPTKEQLERIQNTLTQQIYPIWTNPIIMPPFPIDIKPFQEGGKFPYPIFPPPPGPKESDPEGYAVKSSTLRLNGFTAYVEGTPGPREEIVSIPSTVPDMEKLKLSDIQDKYPKLLLDLYEQGPKDAFYLAKCWANVRFRVDDNNNYFAVDSCYTSKNKFDISVSTKVCSFGAEQVEKDEVYSPRFENGEYKFHLDKSPMCDYMVQFILKLKQLDNEEWMNNVLENFTVLQVITNKSTGEILMVLCFLFEVNKEPDTTCSLFRLTV